MYDVIIVGGRCAGAATATFLGQRGYSVLLIDRDDHPSPTLSTHTFADLELYERLGVLPEIQRSAPPLTRLRIDIEGCVLEADMILTPWASGLRREKLDMILIQRAVSFPTVEWRPRTMVTDLLWENGKVMGVVAQSRTGPATAHARLVVGADGRRSLVARRVKAQTYLEAPEIRCAYYAYFEDVVPLPVPAFEFYWRGTSVAQVQPCDDGLHCICIMPMQEEFASWRKDPAGMLHTELGAFRNLAPRLVRSRRVSSVRGAGDLRSFMRHSYGPGWALVGDAAVATHPVHGAGIDGAVFGANILAEALHKFFSGEGSWKESMADYQGRVDERMRRAFEYATREAGFPPLTSEKVDFLRLVCTIPTLGYMLGTGIDAVLTTVLGDGGPQRLEQLIDPRLRTAQHQQRALDPIPSIIDT